LNNNGVSTQWAVIRITYVSILFVLFTAGFALGDEVVKKNREGIERFNEGQYEEALGAYRDAQLEAPESPELHFNIGNVLYKQKKYDEAQEEYLKALSTEDALLQSQIFYNVGNCQYRLDKLVESIDSYKKSLEVNPDDIDAKYNLEFVRNKLKEMAEQQQQQQQQCQQEQQIQQGEQQQQGGQSQEGEEREEQQAQQQQGEEQQEEGAQEQQQPQKAEGEMTEEEAQRILDALKDDEEEVQKDIRRMQSPGKRRVEKDW
jgi:Ca-activated chloride channel family protein